MRSNILQCNGQSCTLDWMLQLKLEFWRDSRLNMAKFQISFSLCLKFSNFQFTILSTIHLKKRWSEVRNFLRLRTFNNLFDFTTAGKNIGAIYPSIFWTEIFLTWSETPSPPIYLHLIFAILQFEISSLMNWIFFPSLNWIFLPAVAKEIQIILIINFLSCSL